MTILSYLIPISLILGGLGLLGFLYTLRSQQYDDPEGDAQRILSGEWDDHPKPAEPSKPSEN
ncbi:MAG: cbb3-type cytochrome oxidase assembly protein CcoS [Cognatishimia sp.]